MSSDGVKAEDASGGRLTIKMKMKVLDEVKILGRRKGISNGPDQESGFIPFPTPYVF